MFEEVFDIKNQEAFRFGMIVGKLFMKKYEEITRYWTASGECLSVTTEVYKRAESKLFGLLIEEILEEVMNSDTSSLEPADKLDPSKYTAEEVELAEGLYYGFISGEQLGFPTAENLAKASRAMKIFSENMEYGYLQEVYYNENLEEE